MALTNFIECFRMMQCTLHKNLVVIFVRVNSFFFCHNYKNKQSVCFSLNCVNTLQNCLFVDKCCKKNGMTDSARKIRLRQC